MDKKFVKDYRGRGDGTYEYTGDTYRFTGSGEEFRAAFFLLLKYLLVETVCFFVCGVIPGAWFSRVYHLLIPFGIEFLVLGLAFFALYELHSEAKPLKAHIYEKTADRLPVLAGAMTILTVIVAGGIFAGLVVRPLSPESYFAVSGNVVPDVVVAMIQTGMFVLGRRMLKVLDGMVWVKSERPSQSPSVTASPLRFGPRETDVPRTSRAPEGEPRKDEEGEASKGE